MGTTLSESFSDQLNVCSEEFEIFMEWMVAQVGAKETIDAEFVDYVYPEWKRWYDAKVAGVTIPPPMWIRPLKLRTVRW